MRVVNFLINQTCSCRLLSGRVNPSSNKSIKTLACILYPKQSSDVSLLYLLQMPDSRFGCVVVGLKPTTLVAACTRRRCCDKVRNGCNMACSTRFLEHRKQNSPRSRYSCSCVCYHKLIQCSSSEYYSHNDTHPKIT